MLRSSAGSAGNCSSEGLALALLNFGSPLTAAREVAETLNATLVDMRFVKPLDTERLQQLAASHDVLVTLEENAVIGGAGAAVGQWLQAQQMRTGKAPAVLNLGLPDHFVSHGKPKQLLAEEGLDADGILRQIRAYIARAD